MSSTEVNPRCSVPGGNALLRLGTAEEMPAFLVLRGWKHSGSLDAGQGKNTQHFCSAWRGQEKHGGLLKAEKTDT